MKYVLAALALVMLGACDPNASPSAPQHHIGDTIREQETAFVSAVSNKNAAAAAAFYAPDAQMFNPDEEPRTTPQGILATYQQLVADPNGSLNLHNDDVIIPSSGDYAIAQGTFTVSYSNPRTHQRTWVEGTYVTLWRRQADGSWKIMRDIATPGPAPAAPSRP